MNFRSVLGALAVAALLSGCSQGVDLTVVNRSESTITDVVASGTGFSVELGEFHPGEERETKINPVGESGLQLSFKSLGQQYSSGAQGYFEGSRNYSVVATVSPEFAVSVETSINR